MLNRSDEQKGVLLKRRPFFASLATIVAAGLSAGSLLPRLLGSHGSPPTVDAPIRITPNSLAVPRSSKDSTFHG